MKVTVIVPVRNEGERVTETLESLYEQSRLPDEIVAGDGMSTDDTRKRIMSFADRGIPVRVVDNPSLFAGGGRNAATACATGDLIVNLDVGNLPDRRWLEELVRPFEQDEALDYAGGIYIPLMTSPFERVSGAIIYYNDSVGMNWTREELERNVPSDPLPGGNCMAYRKHIWQRAGGFCEWARKGQDRLFSYRVRDIGGKIAMTLDSVMHHHMASSLRDVFDRHFNYDLWLGRMALSRSRFRSLLRVYSVGLIALASCWFVPILALVLPLLVLAYIYVAAWRKLDTLTRLTRRPFTLRQRLQAVAVLFVRDFAVLAGGTRGSLERLLDPSWRRMTREYLEHGRQPSFSTSRTD